MVGKNAGWGLALLGCLLTTIMLVGSAALADEYLPGDKVEAVIGAEGETGVDVVKAGTTVILKGKIKSARTKYLIWRLQQKFVNIIDLTSMEADAFKNLQEMEKSFSQELALSFDSQAQKSISENLQFRIVEGRLVVSGKVNNEEDITRITNIAKIYDNDPVINVEIREDMIEIDAIFCRINRVNGNHFGSQGMQSATITVPQYSLTYSGAGMSKLSKAANAHDGTYTNNGWDFGISSGTSVLNKLTSYFNVAETDVNLLVRPHLSTLNGKEAVFHSGGQQPFTIATDSVQTIEWKDYGTKLTVKPVLTTDSKIDVDVTIEFTIPLNDSEDRFTKFSHTGRAILGENQALILSGLVQQLYSLEIARTPGISKVPLLNFFFGDKDRSHDQSEMVVVVMPRLTRPINDGKGSFNFRTSEQSNKVLKETEKAMGTIPALKANIRPLEEEEVTVPGVESLEPAADSSKAEK